MRSIIIFIFTIFSISCTAQSFCGKCYTSPYCTDSISGNLQFQDDAGFFGDSDGNYIVPGGVAPPLTFTDNYSIAATDVFNSITITIYDGWLSHTIFINAAGGSEVLNDGDGGLDLSGDLTVEVVLSTAECNSIRTVFSIYVGCGAPVASFAFSTESDGCPGPCIPPTSGFIFDTGVGCPLPKGKLIPGFQFNLGNE